MADQGQRGGRVQQAVAAEPSIAGLLSQISGQLDDIITRLDGIAASGGSENIMSYDYLTRTIPANSNDFEIRIPVPASVTYVTFDQAVSFRVNEISAAQIPWRAMVEFRISPMRTDRIYATTGSTATTVEIRTLLSEADMSRGRLRAR